MSQDHEIKVVLLCCDGLFQRYLAMRLAEEYDLLGIVIHATPSAKGTLTQRLMRYLNPVKFYQYIASRILIPRYERKAKDVIENLFFINTKLPELPPDVPKIFVSDINSPEAVDFVSALNPTVVCVNGTNLLRAPMLSLSKKIPLGIINLHTGLSPYSRGGNCNLFMLMRGQPQYVGATVHYIDPGIDSGDIIYSVRPNISESDILETIEAKSFHIGIEKMVQAIKEIKNGTACRVKQWTEGTLFLRKTGYVFRPYFKIVVNKKIEKGLLETYLNHQKKYDLDVKLVGNS
ncbi:MAG: formyl transferase [Gammaproteobacteria bacterium]|nr:formyl transferase [Gammaproteobacteria bacterium]